LNKKPNSELVKLTLSGDGEAWRALHERYIKQAQFFARSEKNIPEADVDGLVNDSFAQAHEELGSLNNQSGFKAWYIQILRNKCNDFYNKRKKQPSSLQSEDVTMPSKSETPVDKLILEEECFQILDALFENNKEDLYVFYAREHYGILPKSIGEKRGREYTWVRKRLSDIKKKIRNILEKNDNV